MTDGSPIVSANEPIAKPRQPRFTADQITESSKLLLDLGKLLVATVVIGYFVPAVSGEISTIGFVIAAILSLSAFGFGLWILKFKSKYRHPPQKPTTSKSTSVEN